MTDAAKREDPADCGRFWLQSNPAMLTTGILSALAVINGCYMSAQSMALVMMPSARAAMAWLRHVTKALFTSDAPSHTCTVQPRAFPAATTPAVPTAQLVA